MKTTLWCDGKRHLWLEGNEARLQYKDCVYGFGCQPYEPMAIIQPLNGAGNVYIHNAFDVEEECKTMILNPKHYVSLINGHYLTAGLFCRLLTAAIDYGNDIQVDEAEQKMLQQLLEEKGVRSLPIWPRDFKKEKILYRRTDVFLGYFETPSETVYALAFDYPHKGERERLVYYHITESEYKNYLQLPDKQRWRTQNETEEWYKRNLMERMVLCNQLDHLPSAHIPFFTLSMLNNA